MSKYDWTEGLRLSLQKPGDKIPKGWHSRESLARKDGISTRWAGDILLAAYVSGKCQRRKFRVTGPGGDTRHILFYGPK